MSSGNGSEGIAPTSIATVALGEGRHAHDRIDGLRERLDWHAQQLNAQIAGVESNASQRMHELKSAVGAFGATAEATASRVVVLGVRVDELIEAIGPEPSNRASIHDLSDADIAVLSQQGIRGQLAVMWSAQIADRNARIAERKRAAAAAEESASQLARVQRGQARSTSLLALLVVVLTGAAESGVLGALLRALFGG